MNELLHTAQIGIVAGVPLMVTNYNEKRNCVGRSLFMRQRVCARTLPSGKKRFRIAHTPITCWAFASHHIGHRTRREYNFDGNEGVCSMITILDTILSSECVLRYVAQ